MLPVLVITYSDFFLLFFQILPATLALAGSCCLIAPENLPAQARPGDFAQIHQKLGPFLNSSVQVQIWTRNLATYGKLFYKLSNFDIYLHFIRHNFNFLYRILTSWISIMPTCKRELTATGHASIAVSLLPVWLTARPAADPKHNITCIEHSLVFLLALEFLHI
jgi:hypothetical protein